MQSRIVLSLLLLSVGHDAIVLAQSPGDFTATGSMITPRVYHTSTLLMTGKVLITGGMYSNGFAATASAELYDPASGTFARTGDMTRPRSSHTATLLPDGRVLIVGGAFGNLTAELFDPETGTFSTTGNTISDHQCQQAILLGTGKVFIVGGAANDGFDPTPGAELYDPATGTFAPAGTYANDNYYYGFNTCQGAGSASLADGRVLIVWDEGGAEIYDPGRGTFTRTSYTNPADYNDLPPTATLLLDGNVLVAGGANQPVVYTGAELYDSTTGTFTPTGDMTAARALASTILLPDGTVLMAGGLPFDFFGPAHASAELYDPVRGLFTPTSDMTTARWGHTATLLNNGRVLVVGGAIDLRNDVTGWSPISTAELYTPSVLLPPPVLLSLSGEGPGQGAVLHAGTARVVTASDPAVPGEALEIYGTGLKDGSVIPPQVFIGGQMAELLYFGDAPGYPGCNQVNVRVPGGVAPGSAVSVRLNYLNRPSNAVTIGVQ